MQGDLLKTLPTRKLTCPRKRDDFKRKFIFQQSIFRGYVSFREGTWWCLCDKIKSTQCRPSIFDGFWAFNLPKTSSQVACAWLRICQYHSVTPPQMQASFEFQKWLYIAYSLQKYIKGHTRWFCGGCCNKNSTIYERKRKRLISFIPTTPRVRDGKWIHCQIQKKKLKFVWKKNTNEMVISHEFCDTSQIENIHTSCICIWDRPFVSLDHTGHSKSRAVQKLARSPQMSSALPFAAPSSEAPAANGPRPLGPEAAF